MSSSTENPIAAFKGPLTGTTAANDFYKTWDEINTFWLLTMAIAARLDIDADVFSSSSQDSSKPEWHVLTRKSMVIQMGRHSNYLFSITLSRHIDNYLNYLSSILYLIFITKPDILKTSEKIDIALVLSFDSIEDLVQELANRKVEGLSYQSLKDLCDFFDNRLGITILDPQELEYMTELVETRNLITHNRGIINKRYVHKTNSDSSMIGKLRTVKVKETMEYIPLLANSVKRIDSAVCSKFKIRGKRLDAPARPA